MAKGRDTMTQYLAKSMHQCPVPFNRILWQNCTAGPDGKQREEQKKHGPVSESGSQMINQNNKKAGRKKRGKVKEKLGDNETAEGKNNKQGLAMQQKRH